MSDEPKGERDQPRIRGLDGQEHVMSSGDPEAVVVSAPVRTVANDERERSLARAADVLQANPGFREDPTKWSDVVILACAELAHAYLAHGPARERELRELVAACEGAVEAIDAIAAQPGSRIAVTEFIRVRIKTARAAVARVRAGGGPG